jgi:hypothetical protein
VSLSSPWEERHSGPSRPVPPARGKRVCRALATSDAGGRRKTGLGDASSAAAAWDISSKGPFFVELFARVLMFGLRRLTSPPHLGQTFPPNTRRCGKTARLVFATAVHKTGGHQARSSGIVIPSDCSLPDIPAASRTGVHHDHPHTPARRRVRRWG